MKLKTVILAGVSLLAMTAHAYAFEAIGSLIISALLSIGAASILPAASAAAIGAGAVGIGLAAANLATSFFFKKPSVDPQAVKTTTKGSEGPGRYATGRVELGAKIAFGNTAGYQIFRLLLHCFGPIAAVEEYFYDGREITVEANGDVSSPPWATKTGSYLNLKTKLGDGTETAWSDLLTYFPTSWTADHRVRGIAQTLLRATNPGTGSSKFPRLYQGGIKEAKIRARVGKFYDPRTGNTAWTINGVLQCLHWFRMLPGVVDDAIDFDEIGLVASQGEALVATATGTEPRCQMSGGWEGPLTYDVVLDMLESCGLEVRTSDSGKFTFAFMEDDPESEITLRSRHIIDLYPQAGPEGAKRPNKCTLKYFSPERRYEMAEIDLTDAPWARVEDEIDRYGEQEFPVELVFCCSASQAQRIARRLFHMARADYGTVKTIFAGLATWGKQTITLEIPDVGEDGASVLVKCRKGTARVNDEEGTCDIPFTIIPEILKTPWNPETDEVPAPPVLTAVQYESDLDTPDPPSAATVVEYQDGSFETRIQFASVEDADTAEAVYRNYTDGLPNPFASMTEYATGGGVIGGSGSTMYGYAPVNLVGQRGDFKVRFFNSDDDASYYSDLLTVDPMVIDNTAPAAPTLNVSATQDGTIKSYVATARCTSLNVAKIIVTFAATGSPGGSTSGNARPNQAVNGGGSVQTDQGPKTVGITARASSSDGTASAIAGYTDIITG